MIHPARAHCPRILRLAAVGATGLAAVLAACSDATPPPAPSAGDGRIPVAASVPPAAWVVDRIGGEQVAVTTLLPAGRSPHTWEPAPRELAALARARLLVIVGHPAMPFEDRLLAAARRDGDPEVVVMSDGVTLLPETAGHEQLREDGSGDRRRLAATDPHVWLDPMVMRATAGRIAEALSEVDPAHAPLYQERLERLDDRIDALHREILGLLDDLPERRFLAYHPAWGYFAARYGLVQEAVEAGGKEPGTRRLVERVAAARERGAPTIFVQTSVYGRGARVIADEIGAEVVALDPLAYDWPVNLRRVATAMAAALGGDVPGRASRSPHEIPQEAEP